MSSGSHVDPPECCFTVYKWSFQGSVFCFVFLSTATLLYLIDNYFFVCLFLVAATVLSWCSTPTSQKQLGSVVFTPAQSTPNIRNQDIGQILPLFFSKFPLTQAFFFLACYWCHEPIFSIFAACNLRIVHFYEAVLSNCAHWPFSSSCSVSVVFHLLQVLDTNEGQRRHKPQNNTNRWCSTTK